jgi:hypothetical protein
MTARVTVEMVDAMLVDAIRRTTEAGHAALERGEQVDVKAFRIAIDELEQQVQGMPGGYDAWCRFFNRGAERRRRIHNEIARGRVELVARSPRPLNEYEVTFDDAIPASLAAGFAAPALKRLGDVRCPVDAGGDVDDGA